MSNVMNPAVVSWQQSGKNDDGSAFTAAQYAGTELSLDGVAAVSVPVVFATDGKYQMPLASLASFATLPNGTHTAAVRVVAVNGKKSALSPAGSFDVDRRTPEPPFAVSFA